MLSLFRHELSTRRGGIIGWSIGLVIYAAMYTAFFPAMPDEMLAIDYENIELFQAFGEMSMSTFEGYMGSSVFNFLGVLVGIFAVIAGVASLAGEEETGTLEPLVTLPLPRWQLVTAKALGLAVAVLIPLVAAGLAVAGVYLAVRDQITTSLGAGDLFLSTLEIWPLALLLVTASLFLGALLPSRRTASAAAAAILIASFFGNNLAGMFDALDPLRTLSPFHYVDTSPQGLAGGIEPRNALILLAAALVFYLLTVWSFGARDITVGRWAVSRTRRRRVDAPERRPAGG